MEFMCQKDTEELNNASEEQICFCCDHIGDFAVGNAQGIFQRVNRALHTGPAAVDLEKSGIISGDTRIQAQIFVERHINAAAIF